MARLKITNDELQTRFKELGKSHAELFYFKDLHDQAKTQLTQLTTELTASKKANERDLAVLRERDTAVEHEVEVKKLKHQKEKLLEEGTTSSEQTSMLEQSMAGVQRQMDTMKEKQKEQETSIRDLRAQEDKMAYQMRQLREELDRTTEKLKKTTEELAKA